MLFNSMLEDLRVRVTSLMTRVEMRPDAPPPMPEPVRITDMRHPSPDGGDFEGQGDVAVAPRRGEAVDPNDPATWAGTPRNSACPCGSGKKYKHCHGRV